MSQLRRAASAALRSATLQHFAQHQDAFLKAFARPYASNAVAEALHDAANKSGLSEYSAVAGLAASVQPTSRPGPLLSLTSLGGSSLLSQPHIRCMSSSGASTSGGSSSSGSGGSSGSSSSGGGKGPGGEARDVTGASNLLGGLKLQVPSNPFASRKPRPAVQKLVLYRGRGMLFFRFVVRAKVFQLMGFLAAAVFASVVLTTNNPDPMDLAAVGALAVGCVVTSYCIWYYSGRYVGEMSLLLPERRMVRFSVLDFWGNREDNDVPLERVVPPWRQRSVAEVRGQARQALMPVVVEGDREYYISVPHGHVLQKELLQKLLYGAPLDGEPVSPSSSATTSSEAAPSSSGSGGSGSGNGGSGIESKGGVAAVSGSAPEAGVQGVQGSSEAVTAGGSTTAGGGSGVAPGGGKAESTEPGSGTGRAV